MRHIKQLASLLLPCIFCLTAAGQNVGINVANPLQELHIDSSIKLGKNVPIGSETPGRKNLVKFGDDDYVTMGEEVSDDKLYLRYGTLVLTKSNGSAGFGYLGINTEEPTAQLDIAGSVRIRNNAGTGKVLTSDGSGYAFWQTPAAPVIPPSTRSDLKTLGAASIFGRENVFVTKIIGNGGAYYSGAVAGSLYAALDLPDSALIQSITFNFIDNSVANNYEFGMRRDNIASNGGSGSPFTLTSTGASSAYQSLTHTFTTPYMIRNDIWSFYLSMSGVFSGTGDALLKSIQVRYSYKTSN